MQGRKKLKNTINCLQITWRWNPNNLETIINIFGKKHNLSSTVDGSCNGDKQPCDGIRNNVWAVDAVGDSCKVANPIVAHINTILCDSWKCWAKYFTKNVLSLPDIPIRRCNPTWLWMIVSKYILLLICKSHVITVDVKNMMFVWFFLAQCIHTWFYRWVFTVWNEQRIEKWIVLEQLLKKLSLFLCLNKVPLCVFW